MLSIEPAGLGGAKEELRSVGTRASVGHRQDSRSSMLQGEVLISELLAVNALTTGTIVVGEITTLAHEVGDHPVEGRALEV